nr:MAG TPA: hypothetical protein [Caudoviricetes sp.]
MCSILYKCVPASLFGRLKQCRKKPEEKQDTRKYHVQRLPLNTPFGCFVENVMRSAVTPAHKNVILPAVRNNYTQHGQHTVIICFIFCRFLVLSGFIECSKCTAKSFFVDHVITPLIPR